MFPIGDVGALAAALSRLLDDSVLREGLARRGHERAAHSFDAEASAARLAGVLRRQLTPGSDASPVIAVPSLKEAART
jgi:glycosyltransferase involved in cell wall biosynthesis